MSSIAKKRLDEVKSKIAIPDFTPSNSKEVQDKLVADWQPKFKTLIDSIDKINIKDIKPADYLGEPLSIELSLEKSDELKKQVSNTVANFILSKKVEPTAENIEKLKVDIEDEYWRLNRKQFLQKYAEQIAEKVAAHYLNKVGNTNKDKGRSNEPAKGGKSPSAYDVWKQKNKISK